MNLLLEKILSKNPTNIFKYMNKFKEINRDIPTIFYENKQFN